MEKKLEKIIEIFVTVYFMENQDLSKSIDLQTTYLLLQNVDLKHTHKPPMKDDRTSHHTIQNEEQHNHNQDQAYQH